MKDNSMSQSCILFLGIHSWGTNREAVKTAKSMGYSTIVLTDRSKLFERKNEFSEADEIIYLDSLNLENVREKIKSLQDTDKKEIACIISFVDPYVYLAAKLSEEFLSCKVRSKAIWVMEDKVETQRHLSPHGITARYCIYEKGDSAKALMRKHDLHFPLMVKSPKSAGSKDVIRVDKISQLIRCIRLMRKRYPNDPILFEEYLDGPQYLVETVIYNDAVHLVAIVKQEITVVNGRSIITGYQVLQDPSPQLLSSLEKRIGQIVKLFGMTYGTSHFELRLVRNKWRLIEVNPRMSGGAMNKMIEAATGINLAKESIKLYLNQEPDITPSVNYHVFTQFLIAKSKGQLKMITGIDKAESYHGVYDIFVKPQIGDFIFPPRSMGGRLAYVIVRGKNKQDVRRNAKKAAKSIRFHLKPESKALTLDITPDYALPEDYIV